MGHTQVELLEKSPGACSKIGHSGETRNFASLACNTGDDTQRDRGDLYLRHVEHVTHEFLSFGRRNQDRCRLAKFMEYVWCLGEVGHVEVGDARTGQRFPDGTHIMKRTARLELAVSCRYMVYKTGFLQEQRHAGDED